MDYNQIQKDFEYTINPIVESFEESFEFKLFNVGYRRVVELLTHKGESPFSITKEERLKHLIELANIDFAIEKPTPDKGGPSLFEWQPKIEAELETIAHKQDLLRNTRLLLRKIESEGYTTWFDLNFWDSDNCYHGHIRIH